MSLSVALLDTNTGKYKIQYEDIPNYKQAELLAQLSMNLKNDVNKLAVILPGWNRGIKEEELEKAIELSKKYAIH